LALKQIVLHAYTYIVFHTATGAVPFDWRPVTFPTRWLNSSDYNTTETHQSLDNINGM